MRAKNSEGPALRRSRRLATLAALLAAALLTPWGSGALGGTEAVCETSWASAVSGNWNDASKWTTGTPTMDLTACINLAGTYTVTVVGTRNAESLTLGGGSGTQTLEIEGRVGPRGGNALLRLHNQGNLGGGIGANGVIALNSVGVGAGYAWLDIVAGRGQLTNGGTIRSNPGTHPERFISGELVNNGLLDVDQLTEQQSSATWRNNGTIDIAAGAALEFEGGPGQTFTQAGGTIVNNGAFTATGGVFAFSGGTATNNPIQLVGVDVRPTGGSASLVVLGPGNELGGDIAPGITLTVRATDAFSTVLARTVARTNAGTLRLESTGDGAAAVVGSLTEALSNTGTIHFNVSHPFGELIVTGDLANHGLIDVDESPVWEGPVMPPLADWSNDGTIDIASGAILRLGQGATFTQTGGSILNNGRFVQSAGPFRFQGGTATGNQIELDGVSISPSGGSASLLVLGGNNNLDDVNIPSGITLTIRGTSASATLTTVSGQTNAGTIRLETTGAGSAWLDGSHFFALTNSGTLDFHDAGGAGNLRFDGNLVNNGSLRVDKTVQQLESGSAWTNSGTIDLAARGRIAFTSTAFTQTASGLLKTAVDSETAFGAIGGTGTRSLDGNLSILRRKAFKPGPGVTFDVVTGSSRTGVLAKVLSAIIQQTRYFKPSYSGDRVSLVVTDAHLAATPPSGPRGTPVTLSGSGYPANDMVTLKFKDASGKTTGLGKVATDANGAFSTTKNVPANAVLGIGAFSGKSAITTVTPKASFSVT